MNKVLLIFLFFPMIFTYSQHKIRIQGSAAVPLGQFENSVDVGYGANINFSSFLFIETLEFSFSTGYIVCGLKQDLPDYKFTYKTIPVLIGVRFLMNDVDFIPYVGLEGGVYFNEFLLELNSSIFGSTGIITKETSIGVSPEIGFRINLSEKIDLDVNAKYNRIRSKYVSRAFMVLQTGFLYRF